MKIILKDEEILFRGGNRLCFVHPDDHNIILKVVTPEKKPDARRKAAPLYKKFRPLSAFDINLKELNAFERLGTKGDKVWRHFPRCFGIVETDLGDALCQELIREEDGSISKTLGSYLNEKRVTGEMRRAVEEFLLFLLNNMIVVRDLRTENLIVRKKTGDLCIYMIDGIGDSDFIPIADISNSWAKYKIKRKLNKFRYHLSTTKQAIGDERK